MITGHAFLCDIIIVKTAVIPVYGLKQRDAPSRPLLRDLVLPHKPVRQLLWRARENTIYYLSYRSCLRQPRHGFLGIRPVGCAARVRSAVRFLPSPSTGKSIISREPPWIPRDQCSLAGASRPRRELLAWRGNLVSSLIPTSKLQWFDDGERFDTRYFVAIKGIEMPAWSCILTHWSTGCSKPLIHLTIDVYRGPSGCQVLS